jgi:hypothetical protein
MESPQHDLHLDHVTLRDDTLTHQVRLILVRQRVYVSCNCRATPGQHSKAGKINYDHIGPSDSIAESRRLYNDPENHWAPFTKEDEAKW